MQYARILKSGDPPLKPTQIHMLYDGKAKLRPCGTANLQCSVLQIRRSEIFDFYVVGMDHTAILSAQACGKLSLFTLNVVNKVLIISPPFRLVSKEHISGFKDVFEGLGEI